VQLLATWETNAAALTSKTSGNLGAGAKPGRICTEPKERLACVRSKRMTLNINMDTIGEALQSCVSTARPANVADIDKEDHSNPQLYAES